MKLFLEGGGAINPMEAMEMAIAGEEYKKLQTISPTVGNNFLGVESGTSTCVSVNPGVNLKMNPSLKGGKDENDK
ncbi:hypothetical protein HS088_TW06G00562 [Tripterygium wilfordii]|uniref:Uncharacterized protein n=1 Tax=Tripterygium wilfordii TaxID=458696 RepID=A0A7J7DJ70_TRIWF|nr:hypothetical protein HS088_TW06G00562 [Tripterygium wilfordii]